LTLHTSYAKVTLYTTKTNKGLKMSSEQLLLDPEAQKKVDFTIIDHAKRIDTIHQELAQHMDPNHPLQLSPTEVKDSLDDLKFSEEQVKKYDPSFSDTDTALLQEAREQLEAESTPVSHEIKYADLHEAIQAAKRHLENTDEET
jgi:regulator of replication initiation timing